MLPQKNKEHLPEPSYEITPFGQKRRVLLADKKGHGSMVDELTKRLEENRRLQKKE